MLPKQNKKHSGVTLLIAILILSTILAISFSLATILLAESRNGGDLLRTEPSLYADHGISEEAIFNIRRNTGISTYTSTVGSLTVNSTSSPVSSPVQVVKIPSTNTSFGCTTNCYVLYNPTNPYGAGGYGRIQITFLNVSNPGAKLNIYLCQWDPANPPRDITTGAYADVCSQQNPSNLTYNYMTYQNTSPLTAGQTWDSNSNCGGCMDSTGNKQQELIIYQTNGTPATDLYAQITTYDSSGNPQGVPYFGKTAVTLNSSNAGVSRDLKVVVPNPTLGSSGNANGFLHSRSITINAGQVPSQQTNFPVLVSGTYPYLAYNNNGGNPTGEVQSSAGNDIVFTSDSAGQNIIPYQQEKYVSSTGEIEYWVKVPTITTGTVFYMFYDQANAIDQSDTTAVWDNNYKGVWHFANGATLSLNDATINSNNATKIAGAAASGKIDGGVSNPKLTLPKNSDINPSNITLEFWVNNLNSQANYGYIVDENDDSSGITFQETPNNNGYYITLNNLVFNHYSPYSFSAGFHQIALTYDGSDIKTYIDGILDLDIQASGSIGWDGSIPLHIGGGNAWINLYNGIVDELRISNSARSVDWIRAQYNNQSSPSNFYSIGPEQ